MQYIRYFEEAQRLSHDKSLRMISQTLPRSRSVVHGGTDATESLGKSRLAAIRDILENGYTWTRSNTQRRFHESFLNACVRFLYSHDSSPPDFREIMDENGWTDIRQQCLCMTPRRFGKTVAVGMFVAAVALVVPASEQAIFSTGRRASGKLLELVGQLISQVAGGAERITKSNQETVWVAHPCGRVSKINSYPSCAKTLRGVGGDVVYMEEASFMDLAVFYEVIVPLLEVDRTALICISTPQVCFYFCMNRCILKSTNALLVLFTFVSQDTLNFYSDMFTMKGPDGKELFRSIKVGLACEACIAAGKADSCEHNQDVIPPWKSRDKFDMVKALYGDRKDLLLRESVGLVTEDQSSLYREAWVTCFMESVISPPVPQFVIVACDPNGGGDSNMAIVSATFSAGRMVIVGVDNHPVRGHDEIESVLLAHIAALQLVFPSAWLIFVGESNLGQEADHMKHMLRTNANVYSVMEGGLAGVRTTHKRKELYAMELCKFLSQNALCHLGDITVCANPLKSDADLLKKTMEELKKQMLGFRKIVLHSQTGRSEPRIVYTGKSQGAQDDLIVTATIAAYWGVQFMTQRIQGVPYSILDEPPSCKR